MATEVKGAGIESEAEATGHGAPPVSGPTSVPRFGSAAPLVPPRPGPSQGPSRPPPSIPRAPTVPSNGISSPSISTSEAPPEKQDSALAAVQAELEATRRTLATKDAEVRAVLAQRDAGIAEIKQLRNELSVREHQIELRKARAKELERAVEEHTAKRAELERLVAEHAAKRAELEGELQATRQRPAIAGDGSDDLKLIRGIGPAFERELKRLGVKTFAQIAAWTEQDIEELGPRIKARPERIKREEWVKRANELDAQRNQAGAPPAS
jgi:predicted flap endonuclease-1-like 5' DNA nuclease